MNSAVIMTFIKTIGIKEGNMDAKVTDIRKNERIRMDLAGSVVAVYLLCL
jgi:hypothetical protein